MKVKIKLLTEMLGTVTKDPEVYKTYIESKKPETQNGEKEYLTVDKIEEKGWTGLVFTVTKMDCLFTNT